MSDVVTQRRPMIDLDAFERALRTPSSTDPKDRDPVNEILRVLGGKDDAAETKFPSFAPAKPCLDEANPQAWPIPSPQHAKLEGLAAFRPGLSCGKADGEKLAVKIPLICGDFASIEAGLLGKPQDGTSEHSSEPTDPAKPALASSTDALSLLKEKPQKRSRLPIYVAAALGTVALAALAVIATYDRGTPDEQGLEEVATVNDEAPVWTDPTGRASAVAAAPVPDNLPLIASPEETAGVAPGNTDAPVETAQGQDLPSMVNPTIPETQTADNAQASVAPPNVEEIAKPPVAPVPAPHVSKPKPAKASAHAKAVKPAAQTAHHAGPRNVAAAKPTAAKTAPPAVAAAQSNQAVVQPPASPPPANPAPSNPALSYVQGAVDAIGSTTAKLFNWVH